MNDPRTDVAPPGSRYADQRQYVVVSRLTRLHGPVTGVVRLGRRLNWSGRDTYDLDKPRRLASMYETVLREASNEDELAQWLDGPSLVRMWPSLVLPPQVRRLWEAHFPELAAARRPAA